MTRAKAKHASRPKAATKDSPAASQNIRGQRLVGFYLFADLAPELQDAIWEFACYSSPEIIPIFVNDRTFRFQLRYVPAVPAVLQATSGARAIGLGHFTLVKFEELARNPPRPPPQQQAQQPQGVIPQFQLHIGPNQAQFFQNQHAMPNGIPPQTTQGHAWANAVNQAAVQAQLNSQIQGAIQQQGQQGLQFHGAAHQWAHNHIPQPFAAGGGNQQAAQHHVTSLQTSFGGLIQSIQTGQHSFSQNLAGHYQSIFGGSQQTIATGQQNITQTGAQQQSTFGGNFQLNAGAQQNTMQNGSHPHAGQVVTFPFQAINPSAGALATLAAVAAHAPTAVVLHQNNPQPRLLPDKYFYFNPGSDCFQLQVGYPAGFRYPTFGVMQFPQLLTRVSDLSRHAYLRLVQQFHRSPTGFPAPGRLPDFLTNIQHLIINLELDPCHAEMRSDGFRVWLHQQTKKFCELNIKSTMAKFPKLKNLDLLTEEEPKRGPSEQMVLRHFREAPIQEENGLSFGYAELGLLEMEIRVWMMNEYMGKHGPECPEIRIVVYVPRHYP